MNNAAEFLRTRIDEGSNPIKIINALICVVLTVDVSYLYSELITNFTLFP
jgi:hypothetical protein